MREFTVQDLMSVFGASATSVIASSVGAATVLSAIAWLSREAISKRLTRGIDHEYSEKLVKIEHGYKADLAAFEAQLKARQAEHEARLRGERDTELERLKAQLSGEAKLREIRLSHLQEQMGVVLAETYADLWQVFVVFDDYTKAFVRAGEPSPTERRVRLGEVIGAFRVRFRPRVIFMPAPTAESVIAFDRRLLRMTQQFTRNVERPTGPRLESLPPKRMEKASDLEMKTWEEVGRFVDDEAPALLRQIADDFRKLLGLDVLPSLPVQRSATDAAPELSQSPTGVTPT